MAYRVALGARKACGARNTGVPIQINLELFLDKEGIPFPFS